jgi:hypothetical protein
MTLGGEWGRLWGVFHVQLLAVLFLHAFCHYNLTCILVQIVTTCTTA